MSGWSILPLPKSEQLSALVGMRTRLEGTQTSDAGESHAQEANVAEVSYGETVIVEPEYPDKSSATRRSSRANWGDVPLTRLVVHLGLHRELAGGLGGGGTRLAGGTGTTGRPVKADAED